MDKNLGIVTATVFEDFNPKLLLLKEGDRLIVSGRLNKALDANTLDIARADVEI